MPGRPQRAAPLSRESIVAAALALAPRAGLEAVRMRDLAAELDVATGAVYWHFENQAALQAAVVETVLGSVPLPSELSGTPRERIIRHVQLVQQALEDHPGVTGAFIASAPDTPVGAKFRHDIRSIWQEAGLAPAAARAAFLAVEWLWLGSRAARGPHAYDKKTFDLAVAALVDGILGHETDTEGEGAH